LIGISRRIRQISVELFDLCILSTAQGLPGDKQQAERTGKVQDCLIEAKVSEEVSKHGFTPGEALKFVREAVELKNLRILGHAMAPYFPDPEKPGRTSRSL